MSEMTYISVAGTGRINYVNWEAAAPLVSGLCHRYEIRYDIDAEYRYSVSISEQRCLLLNSMQYCSGIKLNNIHFRERMRRPTVCVLWPFLQHAVRHSAAYNSVRLTVCSSGTFVWLFETIKNTTKLFMFVVLVCSSQNCQEIPTQSLLGFLSWLGY